MMKASTQTNGLSSKFSTLLRTTSFMPVLFGLLSLLDFISWSQFFLEILDIYRHVRDLIADSLFYWWTDYRIPKRVADYFVVYTGICVALHEHIRNWDYGPDSRYDLDFYDWFEMSDSKVQELELRLEANRTKRDSVHWARKWGKTFLIRLSMYLVLPFYVIYILLMAGFVWMSSAKTLYKLRGEYNNQLDPMGQTKSFLKYIATVVVALVILLFINYQLASFSL